VAFAEYPAVDPGTFVIQGCCGTMRIAPVRDTETLARGGWSAGAESVSRCRTPFPSKSIRVSVAAGPPQRSVPAGVHCQPSKGTAFVVGVQDG